MGPHSFKCGKFGGLKSDGRRTDASMGPHSFKCGKVSLSHIFESYFQLLQWGRTLSSAERAANENLKGTFADGLQWGRTLSSAESQKSRRSYRVGAWGASMGPHSFKCGKSTGFL